MKKIKWIIAFIIILFSCRDNSSKCEELKDHPHLMDLKLLDSTDLEFPVNYIANCHGYYEEIEEQFRVGCIQELSLDSIKYLKEDICGGPITGLWVVKEMRTYDNMNCFGPYENVKDSITWQYGAGVSLFIDFLPREVTQRIIGSYSDTTLCKMGLGVLESDSCLTFVGNISIDSLCFQNNGTYSYESGRCSYDLYFDKMNYSISSNNITLSKLDSNNVETFYEGNWEIKQYSNLLISFYNQHSCKYIEAERF
tara:strand:+ start:11016 stop:11774 length:759 start_codon:yes stop_codon:yes gene_type:complete